MYLLLNADERVFGVSVFYFIAMKFDEWQLTVVNVPAKLLVLETPLFSWVHWLALISDGLIRHPYLGKGHFVAHMWNGDILWSVIGWGDISLTVYEQEDILVMGVREGYLTIHIYR